MGDRIFPGDVVFKVEGWSLPHGSIGPFGFIVVWGEMPVGFGVSDPTAKY